MRLLLNRFVFCLSVGVTAVTFSAPSAHALSGNPERDFIMSCTYGVLAGTLVGAASLAFVDKPGDNLQRVARGASLGLYAGIALGYYTVYYLPKKLQQEEEDRLNPDNVFYQSEDNLKKNEFAVFPALATDSETRSSALGLGLNLTF